MIKLIYEEKNIINIIKNPETRSPILIGTIIFILSIIVIYLKRKESKSKI